MTITKSQMADGHIKGNVLDSTPAKTNKIDLCRCMKITVRL